MTEKTTALATRTILAVLLGAALGLAGAGLVPAPACTPAGQQDALRASRAALAVAEFGCSALAEPRDRELCLASQELAEAIADCIAARSGQTPDAGPQDRICQAASRVADDVSIDLQAAAVYAPGEPGPPPSADP